MKLLLGNVSYAKREEGLVATLCSPGGPGKEMGNLKLRLHYKNGNLEFSEDYHDNSNLKSNILMFNYYVSKRKCFERS